MEGMNSCEEVHKGNHSVFFIIDDIGVSRSIKEYCD